MPHSADNTVPPADNTVTPADSIRAPAYHAHTGTRVHCSCSHTTASAMLYAALKWLFDLRHSKTLRYVTAASLRHSRYATSQALRYVTAATPQPLCYRCHPRRHPCNTHTRLSRAYCAYADVLNVMPQVTGARGVV